MLHAGGTGSRVDRSWPLGRLRRFWGRLCSHRKPARRKPHPTRRSPPRRSLRHGGSAALGVPPNVSQQDHAPHGAAPAAGPPCWGGRSRASPGRGVCCSPHTRAAEAPLSGPERLGPRPGRPPRCRSRDCLGVLYLSKGHARRPGHGFRLRCVQPVSITWWLRNTSRSAHRRNQGCGTRVPLVLPRAAIAMPTRTCRVCPRQRWRSRGPSGEAPRGSRTARARSHHRSVRGRRVKPTCLTTV